MMIASTRFLAAQRQALLKRRPIIAGGFRLPFSHTREERWPVATKKFRLAPSRVVILHTGRYFLCQGYRAHAQVTLPAVIFGQMPLQASYSD